MKLHFVDLPDAFRPGLNEVAPLLKIEESVRGIPVEFAWGEGITVSLEQGKGKIVCGRKHLFFRALSLFVQHAKKESSFSVHEDTPFTMVGVMIDASRNAVWTVKTIRHYLRILALMGYNFAMMYTEDTYTVPEKPYFGYLRGRYTYDELKACDDYADMLGIEMTPCIQVYGHLEVYFQWNEANPIKDTSSVLLAGEEKTYAFIEQCLRAASAPFRSKRIHIGMDETMDMGTGAYMRKNGFVNRFDIFTGHLNRVMEITRQMGLQPMIWSDMFFRLGNAYDDYYAKDSVIPAHVKEAIPTDVDLVFWHYGTRPGCDNYMLNMHKELNRHIIYAGGISCWFGHFPEIRFSILSTEAGIKACREHKVYEFMTTLWGNSGAEMDPYSSLLAMQHTAEWLYNTEPSFAHVAERFEVCTGGNAQDFMDMGQYINMFEEDTRYTGFPARVIARKCLWSDVMEGQFDYDLQHRPMSEHYRKYADKLALRVTPDNPYAKQCELASVLMDLMSLKCFVAERLTIAYANNDRDFLYQAANEYFPAIAEKAENIRKLDRALWYAHKKVFGWVEMDIRYGGLVNRCESATYRINAYLNGELESLDDLAEKRLPYPPFAYTSYKRIYYAGTKN